MSIDNNNKMNTYNNAKINFEKLKQHYILREFPMLNEMTNTSNLENEYKLIKENDIRKIFREEFERISILNEYYQLTRLK